ncbi:MAG: Hsp33 family molecular chaperone HslO [Simplicispira sp.]|nr:Hsp33 family molecular chaperone HslO [Simplicispira sp.]
MSELHKFIFEGLPVRGAIVRLTDAWREMLARRAANTTSGAYPVPVRELLGEMAAAGVLMQSSIKFNGALVLQIFGDGPLRLAVAEVQSDLSLRATAAITGEVHEHATLTALVNVAGGGRCAITLDPQDKFPGQQPYQGVVPLVDAHERPLRFLSEVLAHYMRQSEQLEATLVLAANDQVAAGLLIQRMPVQGEANLAGSSGESAAHGADEEYNRIATLAGSLTREELLSLDVDTILRRLFWEEQVARFAPQAGAQGPRFACSCSRERVGRMLETLGREEAESILAEQGQIEVGCEYCGQQYRFDAVDAAQIFAASSVQQPPAPVSLQ